MTRRLVAAALCCGPLVAATASCAPRQVLRSGDTALPPDHADYGHVLQVRYLGVGGFVLRRGADVVMTAPLYSNPDLGTPLGGRVVPDTSLIDRFHPYVPDVEAILVGHAHYDHLMDVPLVWQRTPNARIYGSTTTRNILAGYQGQPPEGGMFPHPVPAIPPDRVIALDDPADDRVDYRNCASLLPSDSTAAPCKPYPDTRGRWESVIVRDGSTRVRLYAVCSRHPAQLLWIHQAPGCVDEPRDDPPTLGDDYREGETLAYLVDFLGSGGEVEFRVFYQDAPSDGEIGTVPEDVLGDRPVDVALLCVGNWNQVEHAERIVRNLKPRWVVLGHWEDFFKHQGEKLSAAPTVPVSPYFEKIRGELDGLPEPGSREVYLPAPQVLLRFPR